MCLRGASSKGLPQNGFSLAGLYNFFTSRRTKRPAGALKTGAWCETTNVTSVGVLQGRAVVACTWGPFLPVCRLHCLRPTWYEIHCFGFQDGVGWNSVTPREPLLVRLLPPPAHPVAWASSRAFLPALSPAHTSAPPSSSAQIIETQGLPGTQPTTTQLAPTRCSSSVPWLLVVQLLGCRS